MIAFLLLGVISPLLTGSAHASCSPCNLIVNTNVPSSDATVSVIAKGYPAPQNLNHTYTYLNGTINWVQVTSINITGTSGARYIFKQWTFNNIQWSTTANSTELPIMIQDRTVTAIYMKLLPLTLTFTGSAGQNISPPTSVTLDSTLGSATLTSGQYSNHWMQASSWTIASATWQGVYETLGTQTIDLTSTAQQATVIIQVYAAKLQLVDNSNNPISGATVTVTFANSTRAYTFTSDAQGYVNLGLVTPGTFNAQVTYQSNDYGNYPVDPAATPTYTI